MTYRLLSDEFAATMTPAAALAYDAELVADCRQLAHHYAARLAVWQPERAARLLSGYLAATDAGDDDQAERHWDRLMASYDSACIWYGGPPWPA